MQRSLRTTTGILREPSITPCGTLLHRIHQASRTATSTESRHVSQSTSPNQANAYCSTLATKYVPASPLSTKQMAGLHPTSTPKLRHVRSITHVRPALSLALLSLTHQLPDDDYALSQLAAALGKDADAAHFKARAFSAPFTIFNNATGFMEARNASGPWAGQTAGWTEGDMWAYTFDVVHDVPELIKRRGGEAEFVAFLDEHFDGGEYEPSWFEGSAHA